MISYGVQKVEGFCVVASETVVAVGSYRFRRRLCFPARYGHSKDRAYKKTRHINNRNPQLFHDLPPIFINQLFVLVNQPICARQAAPLRSPKKGVQSRRWRDEPTPLRRVPRAKSRQRSDLPVHWQSLHGVISQWHPAPRLLYGGQGPGFQIFPFF